MDGQGGVVGLHNGVRHLGGGDNRVGVHDSVRVLLSEKKKYNKKLTNSGKNYLVN